MILNRDICFSFCFNRTLKLTVVHCGDLLSTIYSLIFMSLWSKKFVILEDVPPKSSSVPKIESQCLASYLAVEP